MLISKRQRGSVELIVLGLLAALIVVLAVPLLSGDDQLLKPGMEPHAAKAAHLAQVNR